MTIWIDIDNPPQVQYLMPLGNAFAARGDEVLVTARDYAITFDLLRQRGVPFEAVGAGFGKGRATKIARTLERAHRLRRVLRRQAARPAALLAGSRASTLTAYSLGIPMFTPCDYEFTELASARLTRSYVLHPDAIEPAAFLERGIRADRLVPFPGLKEHLSFWGVDLDAVEPYRLATVDDELPRVLFRPPSETAHYYANESTSLALATLGRLAERGDAVVVFSPRVPAQAGYLDRFSWQVQPVLLTDAAPFVSLLKAIDLVLAAGGTMTREAAFLGIPAFSILRSRIGQVDRHLEALGRLRVVDDLEELIVARRERSQLDPLGPDPDDVVRHVLAAVDERAGPADHR